jgi:hypothetical protein
MFIIHCKADIGSAELTCTKIMSNTRSLIAICYANSILVYSDITASRLPMSEATSSMFFWIEIDSKKGYHFTYSIFGKPSDLLMIWNNNSKQLLIVYCSQ